MSDRHIGRRRPAAVAVGLVVIAAGAWLAVQPLATGVETIAPRALLERLDGADPPLVLDVRSAGEYAAGHVPGAVNIPYTELPGRLDELRAAREIVVYCQVGGRAAIAEGVLAAAGFERLLHLQGDMRRWLRQDLPVE